MDINRAYKIRKWKHILDNLSEETGVTLKEVCDYIGAVYNGPETSLYVKLPKSRRIYIGVGMAFGQPLDVINSWIMEFAGKRKIYVKDISEDLVWAYLIEANRHDRSKAINYYRRYEDFQSVAFAVFRERWEEIIHNYEDTADVEIKLGQAELGPEYEGIKAFVAEHIDAFKTAYSKPRRYLDKYVGKIIETCRNNPENTTVKSLNSMREYIDDSMINFLSGSSDTINVIDKTTGKRTINIKHVPKGRKKYINLAISIGMTTEDINEFLFLMGYAPLDVHDKEDGTLVMLLTEWEHEHPVQRAFKNKYICGDDTVVLTEAEEFTAVDEMLQLKVDITEEFLKRGESFPYN